MGKYQVREKIFAIGDDYWIEDEHGEKAFLVDAKVLRIRDTFELRDPEGRVVAVIKSKALSIRDAMKIEDAHGEVVATVRKKLFTPFRDKYHVELGDGGELEIHGDLIDKDYRIEDEHGAKVAEISRKWFRFRDTYGVRIADGADAALLLAVAVCVDHLVHQENGG
ncbi:LURP-one-related family protein [Kitasatospora sp. NBC_01287]|uniref:LURP-one-related/scramblase family protein n=1 Tax=Kitasatospora sp. NBC_01287 TaxID=2903573 RepID=UPI00225927CE|nr:LURP-one-related family protein [Kitasatospora sp. NBC_01287]MCX4745883.1 LURP-one-related family protein [Kitasatospora sp. NBC_01287]